MLSQHLQHIMLHIHQHRVWIMYKPSPDVYRVDWLAWNNCKENRDQEITCMKIDVHTISMSVEIAICISIEDIQTVTLHDTDLQRLKVYIIHGWLHKKDNIKQSMQNYWPIWHELAMIDGIVMKGKRIIIPFLLQRQILNQLHNNHMGIEKMRL